ncbi:MAG: ribosomal L7Ae/L30e/S12e/Gadd45 family protein [Lachnospiraceae bacterium]|nr:ribosomal L7Ae/L30e/S12e/Gadd45 family protein [Lachnospiraceae bacterium]
MDRALQLLSLAQRAGKVQSGEFKTEESVKTGQARLVIIASDASDNTKKRFSNMCDFYNVPIIVYSNKDEIGHFIGREFRASVAVTDEGLANKILTLSEMSNQ